MAAHIHHWQEVLAPPQRPTSPRWSEWEDKTAAGIAALVAVGLMFLLWKLLQTPQPVSRKPTTTLAHYWGKVTSPMTTEEIDNQLYAMRDEWERDF